MQPLLNRPFFLALVTSSTALMVGAALICQANFGVPPVLAVLALLYLFTVGLPAVLGVASVAALWGRTGGLVGLPLFVASAVPVALLFQYAACRIIQHVAHARLRRRVGS